MSRTLVAALAICAFALAACRREPVAPPPPLPPPPPEVTAVRFPAPERLVAIGDLHGRLDAAKAALKLAGAIDEADRWIGGKLVVVQTGDEVDRGPNEREILDLFDRLADEARAAGGAVHALLGNHETMNLRGDFHTTGEVGLHAFDGVGTRAPGAEAFPENERSRAAAFLPGGEVATRLSRRDAVAIVGDTVFVHAGVLPAHVAYGLDRANAEIREWAAGRASVVPPVITSRRESFLWVRDYGQPSVSAETCAQLHSALESLHARRMVVGHTIQDGGISSACDGQVWRIDVGYIQFFGQKPAQVLEIRGDQVKVLEAH